MDKPKIYQGVGRRKTAVVRVILSPGKGKILANKKPLDKYFSSYLPKLGEIKTPLKITKRINHYDAFLNLNGGGISGQIEAAQLGIARALVQAEPTLRPTLRKAGLLTRDPRMVERKKSGQPKAHKRFQFSKR